MADEINELIRKKEELIERLNRLIKIIINSEKDSVLIKKLNPIIVQTLKELEEL